MPTPGNERQASYRFWHPQLNITFAWRSEYHAVLRACAAKQITPRDVLLHWARGVLKAETAWGRKSRPRARRTPAPAFQRNNRHVLCG